MSPTESCLVEARLCPECGTSSTCLLQGRKAGGICALSCNLELRKENSEFLKQIYGAGVGEDKLNADIKRQMRWRENGKRTPPRDDALMPSYPQFARALMHVHWGLRFYPQTYKFGTCVSRPVLALQDA